MAGLVPAIHALLVSSAAKTWMPGTSPGMTTTGFAYFAFPRLSKNTPCSPNMFQNHQGRLSLRGRP